jgi:hypothetical protein
MDPNQLAACSCPIGLKQYICKHIIGIMIKHNLVEVPENIKALPLNRKIGRGRPRIIKAGQAPTIDS